MVKKSNIGQGNHYTLDQALIVINKVISRYDGIPYSDKDLLKSVAEGSPRLLCLVQNEVPLLRTSIPWLEDAEGSFSEYEPSGIDCFTGFFYLDEANHCTGLEYVKSIVYGYEHEGISSINCRRQQYTDTSFQHTDYEGYHWTDEPELNIADLGGFDIDCRGAHFFFGTSEFFPEHVPIGSIQPSIDSFYIFEDDLRLFLMCLKSEQHEQLEAFSDEALGFEPEEVANMKSDNGQSGEEQGEAEPVPTKGKPKTVREWILFKSKGGKLPYGAQARYQEELEERFGFLDGKKAVSNAVKALRKAGKLPKS